MKSTPCVMLMFRSRSAPSVGNTSNTFDPFLILSVEVCYGRKCVGGFNVFTVDILSSVEMMAHMRRSVNLDKTNQSPTPPRPLQMSSFL